MNPFKLFINQFNNYARSDRNAILILSGIILLFVIANIVLDNINLKPKYNSSEYEDIFNEWEKAFLNDANAAKYLFHFNLNTVSESKLDSLDIPSFIKQNIFSYRNAGGKFYSETDLQKIYGMTDSIFNLIEPFVEFEKQILHVPKTNIEIKKKTYSGYFDPNKVDFSNLKKFGFSNFQANNLINYREKGGAFFKAGDLLKIYGIDSVFYDTIKKNIQVEKQIEKPKVKQIPESYKVKLNKTDSTGLIKLRGIGNVYATRIIKYRELLGGYYSKEQLLEVYNLPEETYRNVEHQITVDPELIKKININFARYGELLRHPYLNKKQVQALLKFKEINGSFKNIEAIRLVREIDSVTYLKIEPYFTCR